MDIESLREYCLSFPQTTECFPFDETTLVFKVAGKMFLYTDISNSTETWANVKCDPELAIELREKYPTVLPGYLQIKNIGIQYNIAELKTVFLKNGYDILISK